MANHQHRHRAGRGFGDGAGPARPAGPARQRASVRPRRATARQTECWAAKRQARLAGLGFASVEDYLGGAAGRAGLVATAHARRAAGRLGLAEGPDASAAQLVRAGVPALPFGDATFDRLFTSHFYGHLVQTEGMAFLAEARRVAPELVVVDTAAYEGVRPDGWQERVLRDGSRYMIYKRHFTAEGLLAEWGGDGEVLLAGRFFVAVRSWGSWPDTPACLGMRPRRWWQTHWTRERLRPIPDGVL